MPLFEFIMPKRRPTNIEPQRVKHREIGDLKKSPLETEAAIDRPLGPLPNWTTRWIVFVVLSLTVLVLVQIPWILKPLAVATMAALVGTAKASRVTGTELVTQLFVVFVPFKPKRCKLKFIAEIQAENRKNVGAVDWVFFMGFNWFMDRIMQWIWPWKAGELELWVTTARDKRMLAWRGNGNDNFQANLATLTSATGANVKRQ